VTWNENENVARHVRCERYLNLARSTYQVGGPSALVESNFFECSLDLEEVELLAVDLDGWLEDCFDFAEFVGVAGDEVYDVSGCGGGCHFEVGDVS